VTLDDRVTALAFLGLTPRQTRFVATVALHGGYFLRRQYASFVGLVSRGRAVADFLNPLVHSRVMTRVAYRRGRGFVYHLRAKRIYQAIEQDDNRNRHVSPALIARKVMLLDVVLAHPDLTWLATEQDKVALFTDRFHVPVADLPQRNFVVTSRARSVSGSPADPFTTRYFVNKWPIFLRGEGDTARVNFVALIVESTGQAFQHFLQNHIPLLRHLPAWTVLAACPAGLAGLAPCRVVFDRAFSSHPISRGEGAHALAPDLARYFQTRRALETGAVASVSIADLDHYREARTRLLGPAVEHAYARWRIQPRAWPEAAADVPADSTVRPSPSTSPAHGRDTAGGGELQLYPLPFTYRQFGDFAGVC
jgi:hypothetical protein